MKKERKFCGIKGKCKIKKRKKRKVKDERKERKITEVYWEKQKECWENSLGWQWVWRHRKEVREQKDERGEKHLKRITATETYFTKWNQIGIFLIPSWMDRKLRRISLFFLMASLSWHFLETHFPRLPNWKSLFSWQVIPSLLKSGIIHILFSGLANLNKYWPLCWGQPLDWEINFALMPEVCIRLKEGFRISIS